ETLSYSTPAFRHSPLILPYSIFLVNNASHTTAMMAPNTRPLLNIDASVGDMLVNASDGINITPMPPNKETLTILYKICLFSTESTSWNAKLMVREKAGIIAACPTPSGIDGTKGVIYGTKLIATIDRDPSRKGSLLVILVVIIKPADPEIGTAPIAEKHPPSN